MLTDPVEIEIISKAIQKNVRDPNRSREHFNRIFSDFLDRVRFKKAVLLDLGPGQYDFGELARKKGAATYGIDNDPAVIELGQYKGFPVVHGDINDIRGEEFDTKFDGIFCKYSINAFWFTDDAEHEKHIRNITTMIKPGGWAWIAPWNGVTKNESLTEHDIRRILSVQVKAFKSAGFEAVDLTDELSKYYGVHGVTANRALFVLRLKMPRSVRNCSRL